MLVQLLVLSGFFFFNDTATTEIYTLSLHDALPICCARSRARRTRPSPGCCWSTADRKSTRLNSSHPSISYAVFCLKKKKNRIHSDYLQQYNNLYKKRKKYIKKTNS